MSEYIFINADNAGSVTADYAADKRCVCTLTVRENTSPDYAAAMCALDENGCELIPIILIGGGITDATLNPVLKMLWSKTHILTLNMMTEQDAINVIQRNTLPDNVSEQIFLNKAPYYPYGSNVHAYSKLGVILFDAVLIMVLLTAAELLPTQILEALTYLVGIFFAIPILNYILLFAALLLGPIFALKRCYQQWYRTGMNRKTIFMIIFTAVPIAILLFLLM